MRRFSLVVFLLALACLDVHAHVRAQDAAQNLPQHAAEPSPTSGSDAEARIAFESGRDAYHRGAFAEALAQFERAYALSQRPGLLFNIARAADSEGDAERARVAYEAYLEAFPQADNADFVRARITKMQEVEAARRAAMVRAPQPPPPEPVPTVPASAAAPAAPVTLPTVAATTPVVAEPAPPVIARDVPRHDDGEPSSRRRRRALVWTAVGVVVAGGIAGGVLALTRDGGRARAMGDQYVPIPEVP